MQHVVQEVISNGQATIEGVGISGGTGGISLVPQIGQVQYIQDTEDGQIIHYQLHDQYGQILQQDPGHQVSDAHLESYSVQPFAYRRPFSSTHVYDDICHFASLVLFSRLL